MLDGGTLEIMKLKDYVKTNGLSQPSFSVCLKAFKCLPFRTRFIYELNTFHFLRIMTRNVL